MKISSLSSFGGQNSVQPAEVGLDYNKIASDAIAKLGTTVVQNIFTYFGKKYRELKAKTEIMYRTAFQEYLQKAYDTYSKSKTLIYRAEAEYLYNFFECMDVLFKQAHISTCNINNLLEINHMLIISGSGGMGKSTLMKHLLLNAIHDTSLIPIFIELRSLNDIEDDVINYIYYSMTILGFGIDREFFIDSLQTGSYIFLFDGLDEIKEEKLRKVVKAIQDFSNQYRENYFIVSTRPIRNCDTWDNYSVLEVCELSKDQSISLISRIQYDQTKKKRFLDDLKNILYEKHTSFASNPLLLSMMLLTYDEHSNIPEQLTDFYEQAFLTLFNTHDSRKNFVREIQSKLEYGPFKSVFSHLCFQSFFKNQFRFTEPMLYDLLEKTKRSLRVDFPVLGYSNDLVNLVCMLVHDGLHLRFIHRSFQEYFAAVFVTTLSDDIQKSILRPLLSDGFRYDAFLSLLNTLQEERYCTNLIIPIFRELNRNFRNHHCSYQWLLTTIFDSITLRDDIADDSALKVAYVSRASALEYVSAISYLASKDDFSTAPSKESKTQTSVLADMLKGEKANELSFANAQKRGMMEMIYQDSLWVEEWFDSALRVFERLEGQSKRKVRNVTELLANMEAYPINPNQLT